MKDYLNNIKHIEVASGEKFKVYKKVTDESYTASKIIRAFLEKYSLPVNCPGYLEFKMSVENANDFEPENGLGEKLSLIFSNDKGMHLTLNDKKFYIRYIHNILESCQIKKIESKGDSGGQLYSVKYLGNSFRRTYSNIPPKEDFPEIDKLQSWHKVTIYRKD